MEKGIFHQTKNGTPQGGIISPTLANIALDGLEEVVKRNAKPGEKIHFVRYADDWICTGATKELLEDRVLPAVKEFLKKRGLELSMEKTKITRVDEGFDFLGFNIRKYNKKLLIKPSKKAIKSFLVGIREVVKKRKADKAESLIKTLNPKIRGWTNYYCHVVSKKTFSYIDDNMFRLLWKWAKRRHSNKPAKWVKEKYFTQVGMRNWIFFSSAKEGNVYIDIAVRTPIKRFVKIKAEATPYDPVYREYLQRRRMKRNRAKAAWLLKGLS